VMVSVTNDRQTPTIGVSLAGRGLRPFAVVDPLVVDFGTVSDSGPRTRTVTIRNGDGANAPLEVLAVELVDDAGGAFTLDGASVSAEVAVGGDTSFVVGYQPRPATSVGRVLVRTDDPVSPTIEVSLDADGRIPLATVPGALTFDLTRRGDSAPLALEIRNAGNVDLVATVRVVDDGGYAFFVGGDPLTITVPPLTTGSVEVSFAPWSVDTFAGRLEVTINDAAHSPFEVLLEGRSGEPILDLASALDFGAVHLEVTSARALTIGAAAASSFPLDVTRVDLVDDASGAFTIAPPALPALLATQLDEMRRALVVADTLTLPVTRIGTQRAATLRVHNASPDLPLVVTSAAVTSGSSLFAVAPGPYVAGRSIDPTPFVDITVTFTPTSEGDVVGMLRLTSNDTLHATVDVQLVALATYGQLELTLLPGPSGDGPSIQAGSFHALHARAVDGAGDTDSTFTGVVELNATDPLSPLHCAMLLFTADDGGRQSTGYLPAFLTPGIHTLTATLILPDGREVAVGALNVSVEAAPRGQAYVVLPCSDASLAPGAELDASIYVDCGPDDPASLADTLGAFDVRLIVDPLALEVVSIQGGAALGSSPTAPSFRWLGNGVRLMHLIDMGTLTHPVGPDERARGLVELATVRLRVRSTAPDGPTPVCLAVDALTTAEGPGLAPMGAPGPRLGQTVGQVTVESPRAPGPLAVLGGLPRAREAIVGPVQAARDVEVVFSREVDAGAVTVTLMGPQGDVVGVTTRGHLSNVVVFTPSDMLAMGDYTATVTSDALSTAYVLPFRVGAVAAPRAADLDGDGEITITDVALRRPRALAGDATLPNFPPLFLDGVGTIVVREREETHVLLRVVDVEGEDVLLSPEGLPDFARLTRLDEELFELTIDPALVGDGGSIHLNADSDEQSSEGEIEIVVEHVNTPPAIVLVDPRPDELLVLEGDGEGTEYEDDVLTFTLGVVDADLDDPNVAESMTWSLLNDPPIANLEEPEVSADGREAIFTFSPDFTQAGVHEIEVEVTDAEGASSKFTLILTVKNVNRPPEIVVVVPEQPEEQVALGATFTFRFEAMDPDNEGVTDPEKMDPVSVHLDAFTERVLEQVEASGAASVERLEENNVLTLKVTYLLPASIYVYAYASDGIAFSEVVERRVYVVGVATRGRNVPLGSLPQETAPLRPHLIPLVDVEKFADKTHFHRGTIYTDRTFNSGDTAYLLNGPSNIKSVTLSRRDVKTGPWNRVDFVFNSLVSFSGGGFPCELVINSASWGVLKTPIIFVDGGKYPSSNQQMPAPEIKSIEGAEGEGGSSFVYVRLKILKAHIARHVVVRGSSAGVPQLVRMDIVSPPTDDPTLPVEVELLLHVGSYAGPVSFSVLYADPATQNDAYLEGGLATATLEGSGASITTDAYFVRAVQQEDGTVRLVPVTDEDGVAVLPPGAAVEDQSTGPENPYCLRFAHALTGLRPIDSRAVIEIKRSATVDYPVLPDGDDVTIAPITIPMTAGAEAASIGSTTVALVRSDNVVTDEYFVSLPIFLVFRHLEAGSASPVEILEDRIVVSIGLPQGFEGEDQLNGPTTPFPGLLDAKVVGRFEVPRSSAWTPFQISYAKVDSVVPIMPGLVRRSGDDETIRELLDDSLVECHDIVECWFPFPGRDEAQAATDGATEEPTDEPPASDGAAEAFTLYLDDGEGQPLVALTKSDRPLGAMQEYEVEELLVRHEELTPGEHRVRIFPTIPVSSPPDTQPDGPPLLESSFRMILSTRALAAKTAPGVPPPIDCQGATPGDTVQPQVLQGDIALNDEDADCTAKAGGTVLLFTGEEVIDRIDVVIPGCAGLDFVFSRRYRSKIWYDGPLGFCWDFNWNEGLHPHALGVTRQNGKSRMAEWVPLPDGKFAPATEGHSGTLVQREDGTYVLRFDDGLKHVYRLDGRFDAIEDRNGNRLTIHYMGDPDVDRDETQPFNRNNIAYVLDTYQRKISFFYVRKPDPVIVDGTIDRLERLVDFAGRETTFEYDAHGDLIQVTSPKIEGTSTNDDSPGRVEQYDYDFGKDEARADLNHNLLRIFDAEGQQTVELTYGQSKGDFDYDRVTEEFVGGTNESGVAAGGLRQFKYTPFNGPVVVRVTEPNGNVHEHEIDSLGREFVTRVKMRGLRDEEPSAIETRSFFNSDNLLTRRVHPEGNEDLYYYQDTSSRTSRRNVTRHERVPGPRGGPTLVTQFTYEPLYNRLLSVTESRGLSTTFQPPLGPASPARYTTTFSLDYQESTLEIPEAEEFGITIPSHLRGKGDLNGDGRTDQLSGNLVRAVMPPVFLLAESNEAALTGSRVQNVVVLTRWNDDGLEIETVDPKGRITQKKYYPATNPQGAGGILPGDGGSGYLGQTIVDRDGLALTTTFRYDAVGNMIELENARGTVTRLEVNSANEVVSITRDVGGLALRTENYYDDNGRVTTTRAQSAPGAGTYVVKSFVYDTLGKIVEERISREVTSAIEVPEGEITTLYRYDPSGNLVLTRSPEGVFTFTSYDERDLPYTITRGLDSVTQSIVRFDYDQNGNRIRVRDAEDNDGDGKGDATEIRYDGHDRLVETIDALKNRLVVDHDPAGNPIRRRAYGNRSAFSGEALLADTRTDFDELNRPFRVVQKLFDASGDDTGVVVTTRTDFDALSRPTFSVEDDGEVTQLRYDGAGRLHETEDALGNLVVRQLDESGNATMVTSLEKSPEGLLPRTAFATVYQFDALDRVVRVTDNAGHTARMEYDGRDNLVLQTDPEGAPVSDPEGLFPRLINGPGNRTSFTYDGLDRLIAQTTELRVGGTGAGAFSGSIVVRYEFDDDSRPTAIVDDKGNRTTFEYDLQGRKKTQTNADTFQHRFAYDRDDNPTLVTDPNGTKVKRTFDALNRLIDCAVALGDGVVGTQHETYAYDGLSRLIESQDDNGGPTNVTRYEYDSLGRLLTEEQNGRRVTSTYAGDGRRTEVRYPGARAVSYAFDAIDRVKRVQDLAGTIATFDWVGPGLRPLQRQNQNGTTLSFVAGGYDDAQRVVRLRWTQGTQTVVDREYGYGRAGQRVAERRHDDFGLTDRYTHDSAYRIIATSYDQDGTAGATPRPVRNASYAYDGVGNRQNVTITTEAGATTQTYGADGVNAYRTVGGQARAYDKNGNLTDDGVTLYYYDYKNRLVHVVDRATMTPRAHYQYLPDGRRSVKTTWGDSLGTVRRYLYDGPQEVEEQDELGQTLATYVWAPDYVDELLQFQRTGLHPLRAASLYVHQDARFNVVALTDSNGMVVERRRLDDFGNVEFKDSIGAEVATSPSDLLYGFQGRRHDPETGLYHFRARQYDAKTGRFLQRDPVWDSANAGNQYSFAGNSPATGLDPSGLEQASWWNTPGGFNQGNNAALTAPKYGGQNRGWQPLFSGTSHGIGRALMDMVGSAWEGLKDRIVDPRRWGLMLIGPVGWSALLAWEGYNAVVGTGQLVYFTAESLVNGAEGLASGDYEGAAYHLTNAAVGFASLTLGAKGALSLGARALRGSYSWAAHKPGCFLAGTLVETAEGRRPIEEIKEGDRVLSRDERTGEQAFKRVARLFRGHTSRVVRVDVVELRPAKQRGRSERHRVGTAGREESAEDGSDPDLTQAIRCTTEHPFWVLGAGWTPAHRLRAGDRLSSSEGAELMVVACETVAEEADHFNFEVEDWHTYFVAGDEGARPVWVHNKCFIARMDEAVARHGGVRLAGSDVPHNSFRFPSARAARQAASEAAGNLGATPTVYRARDFWGNRPHWARGASNKKMGMGTAELNPSNGNSVAGWRDDYFGHQFPDGSVVGPHVNVWGREGSAHFWYGDAVPAGAW
jgi:RHS repeat-associated protein